MWFPAEVGHFVEGGGRAGEFRAQGAHFLAPVGGQFGQPGVRGLGGQHPVGDHGLQAVAVQGQSGAGPAHGVGGVRAGGHHEPYGRGGVLDHGLGAGQFPVGAGGGLVGPGAGRGHTGELGEDGAQGAGGLPFPGTSRAM